MAYKVLKKEEITETKDYWGIPAPKVYDAAIYEDTRANGIIFVRFDEFWKVWKYRTNKGGWAKIKDREIIEQLNNITDKG